MNLELRLDGGWSFLAQVKSDPDLLSIPVVVTSIEPASEHGPRALAAGAQAYIEKQFHFDEFVEQVKQACGTDVKDELHCIGQVISGLIEGPVQ